MLSLKSSLLFSTLSPPGSTASSSPTSLRPFMTAPMVTPAPSITTTTITKETLPPTITTTSPTTTPSATPSHTKSAPISMPKGRGRSSSLSLSPSSSSASPTISPSPLSLTSSSSSATSASLSPSSSSLPSPRRRATTTTTRPKQIKTSSPSSSFSSSFNNASPSPLRTFQRQQSSPRASSISPSPPSPPSFLLTPVSPLTIQSSEVRRTVVEEEEEEEEEEEGDEAIWFDRWEGEGRKKSVEEKENVEGMEDFQSVLRSITESFLEMNRGSLFRETFLSEIKKRQIRTLSSLDSFVSSPDWVLVAIPLIGKLVVENQLLKEKARIKDKEMKEREFEIQRLKIDLEIYEQNRTLYKQQFQKPQQPQKQEQQAQQQTEQSPSLLSLPPQHPAQQPQQQQHEKLHRHLNDIEKKLNELLEEDLSSVQSLHNFSLPSELSEFLPENTQMSQMEGN